MNFLASTAENGLRIKILQVIKYVLESLKFTNSYYFNGLIIFNFSPFTVCCESRQILGDHR